MITTSNKLDWFSFIRIKSPWNAIVRMYFWFSDDWSNWILQSHMCCVCVRVSVGCFYCQTCIQKETKSRGKKPNSSQDHLFSCYNPTHMTWLCTKHTNKYNTHSQYLYSHTHTHIQTRRNKKSINLIWLFCSHSHFKWAFASQHAN